VVSHRMSKIIFLPAEKSVEVPVGTVIADAAAEAGLMLDAPCGGQGRCGKCLVKVEQGRVSDAESLHLTAEQSQQGWVLSCVTKVAGDAVIMVPSGRERDAVAAEGSTTRVANTVHLDWPILPAVQQLFVELPVPSLVDNTDDFSRLSAELGNKYGIENLDADLPVIQELSDKLRQGNWQATVTVDTSNQECAAILSRVSSGCQKNPLLGVAVDIGTTNVVITMVDLVTGRNMGQLSAPNKQATCGEDVISRIIYGERKGNLKRLNLLVIQTINELVDELVRQQSIKASDIYRMVIAGNTTMIHFLLSLQPKYIRLEPYVPVATHFPLVSARELGIEINPAASVYCLPAIAAYVGGDITAGVLGSRLFESDKLTLFLDIGTNGEIVLGNADWMMSCACSAGPAFEGAGISCGMPAVTGAIEDVTINSETFETTLKVVGDVLPLGICGSGMISAIAEMLVTGVIDKAGHIWQADGAKSRVRVGRRGAEYVLCWAAESGTGKDITLTEVDINNLIRTKAAIYAGVVVMVKSLGISLADIEQVYIGGAFGRNLNIAQAIQIGLFPDLPWEKYHYLGNTSLLGAYNVLLSRQAQQKAEDIAREVTYLELITNSSFMNELTAASFLPHTDLANFPSVKMITD